MLRNNCIVTVWGIHDSGSSTRLQVSQNRRTKDGSYITDYSGFLFFRDPIDREFIRTSLSPDRRARVRIGEISVRRGKWENNGEVTYPTNVFVRGIQMAERTTRPEEQGEKVPDFAEIDDETVRLPF